MQTLGERARGAELDLLWPLGQMPKEGVAKRPVTEEHNAPYDLPDLTRQDDNSPPSHLARHGIDYENFAAKVVKLAEDCGLRVE